MGGVKVAGGNCCFHLHLQQRLLPHSHHHAHGFSSSPQTLSSIFSSISSSSSSSKRKTKRRGIDGRDHPTLTYQIPMKQRSPFLAQTSSTSKLSRRPSLDDLKAISATRRGKHQILRRASSASLDSFAHGDDGVGDDELVRRLDELASNLHQGSNKILPNARRNQQDAEPTSKAFPFSSSVHRNPVSPSAVGPEPPNWLDRDEITMEMKANSVDLPVSLRIIKQQRKKKKREEGLREAGDSACCSVEKAFSSMVFIVRELQSYTLQMREILFSEKNLQGILARVQEEMNASFVWLFQQIFSCTPTLMVYVMLLLANFTVYSIGHNSPAIADAVPQQPAQAFVAIEQEQQHTLQRLDAPSIRFFSAGRRASVGGSGGGKVKPGAGATDDGDQSKGSSYHFRRRIIPDGRMSTASPPATVADESAATVVKTEEEEAAVWSGMVEEASKMQSTNSSLQQLVSPVSVELEAEDQSVYLQTELMYHQALSQDPLDVLLLSNFAQFLYLVLHDHDRAEYYFKRAILGEKPADAEALNRYANFLWLARHDLGAAEETYLEAIAAADPSNCYYTANYAHFLWNTGGEDTCYPLDGGDHPHH